VDKSVKKVNVVKCPSFDNYDYSTARSKVFKAAPYRRDMPTEKSTGVKFHKQEPPSTVNLPNKRRTKEQIINRQVLPITRSSNEVKSIVDIAEWGAIQHKKTQERVAMRDSKKAKLTKEVNVVPKSLVGIKQTVSGNANSDYQLPDTKYPDPKNKLTANVELVGLVLAILFFLALLN